MRAFDYVIAAAEACAMVELFSPPVRLSAPLQSAMTVILVLGCVAVVARHFLLPRSLRKKARAFAAHYKPAPLVPALDATHTAHPSTPSNALAPRTLPHIDAQARAAEEALVRYGVGACGPRGFFGTLDVHVALETALARHHGAEACAVYSSAYLAVSSVLGAVPRTDGERQVVYAADGTPCEGLADGAVLARRPVVTFWSADGLAEQFRRGGAAGATGAVVVCDAQPRNWWLLTGLAALRERHEFAFIVIDESAAALPPGVAQRIDVRVGALSTPYGGGYASGRRTPVERQRLGGLGYCFSAALPPHAAAAALASLK